MNERRHDIDWLRVVAILAIFIYHCARFFDTEGWHLKNAEQSFVVDALRSGLIWMWVMELFFLLSGASTWFALKSKTAGQYLLERVKRLLIPLYTVGMLVLLPPQVYFELFTNEGYTGSFWKWLPGHYAGLPSEIARTGIRNLRAPGSLLSFGFDGHLWFLRYLFLISLMTLPLLLYLKSGRGQRWIERLARWSNRRGGVFLFLIPLVLVRTGLGYLFMEERAWTLFFWYAGFFVIGYLMAADKRFTESFRKHSWVCLALWIVGFSGGGGLFVLVLGYEPLPGAEPFSLMFVLWQIVLSITSWSAVVFMLSLGAKHLNFNNKALEYANEAVLPFYLFHQTIILCVGWFVIRWNMGILPKFVIIAAMSFPLIMGLYELLVRHFNAVRFFFGMRPKNRVSETQPPSRELPQG